MNNVKNRLNVPHPRPVAGRMARYGGGRRADKIRREILLHFILRYLFIINDCKRVLSNTTWKIGEQLQNTVSEIHDFGTRS
jgi:hypothetical protein